MLICLTVLTGVIYPLFITLVAQITMSYEANGSFLYKGLKPVGSRLIGQHFSSDKYFWGRPSATGYNPLPSGGSNLSFTSLQLKDEVNARLDDWKQEHGGKTELKVPSDLLFASGSGLDPHISMDAAYFQVDRILKARGMAENERPMLISLIDKMTEGRTLGFMGVPRVNIIKLNKALDELQVAK
jgi:K+-transporting ATPase ATPase C chain